MPWARRAYLLDYGEDESAVPGGCDLVFRVPPPRLPGRPHAYGRPVKRMGGVLVCPKEQGVPRRVELTCSTCRICFSAPRAASGPRTGTRVDRSQPVVAIGPIRG